MDKSVTSIRGQGAEMVVAAGLIGTLEFVAGPGKVGRSINWRVADKTEKLRMMKSDSTNAVIFVECGKRASYQLVRAVFV